MSERSEGPDDRVETPRAGPERDTLASMLDYHRATLLWKVQGLSDEDLRRILVPSGWSLLGLVKHVAGVERWWFRRCFTGEDVEMLWRKGDEDADWRIEPTDTTQAIIDLYQDECARSRAIVDAAGSLDERARLEGRF